MWLWIADNIAPNSIGAGLGAIIPDWFCRDVMSGPFWAELWEL